METIPKEYFIHLKGKKLEDFVESIFQHYRREGFPYFPTNQGYREARFQELMEADVSQILNGNMINRTQHGINLAWSYFPHAFSIECSDMISPMQAFKDDVMFKKIIVKSCKLGDSISDSTIRGLLRLFSGVQAVSNFRPTAAAAIYNHYAPNGIVWDMSGGWGGRMLGAIKVNLKHYIATEPSTKTFKGLSELAQDFAGKTKITLLQKGSEVYKPQKGYLDLCFTSPPYFNLEKYSDEKTQSYKKYSTKNDWVEGFLTQTIENCHYGLKKSGYMIINIADPKKEKKISLEQETLKAAKKVGFTHVNTLVLVLKSPLGSGQLYKTEPVFVFKK